MNFTVFGSTGFIGRNLVSYLESKGHDVYCPRREDIASLSGKNLGHAIYAIGLTGSRPMPFEMVDAHVGILEKLLREARYESWLYLSSTRLYGTDQQASATEDQMLQVRPVPSALFDISKMLGESLCLSVDNPAVRIARLSNVYGAGQSEHTFLGSVIADARRENSVVIGEDPLSAKDYISVSDASQVLRAIALSGKQRIYNVASGVRTTHQELAHELGKLGCNVSFKESGVLRAFPPIDISRIREEFMFAHSSFPEAVSALYKRHEI